jgi:signal transduction histidine kinase
MLFVLAIGIWAVLPEYGVVAALRRNDAGGILARRLLIPVVLLPLAIGWLEGRGVTARLFDAPFGMATFAFLMIVLLTWLVVATASKVSESAAELRAADRRKDDFLATLAHELRNPLAPLRNALEIMRVAPGNAASAASARATMERQVRHMVRLIDDLLDVSRISRDKMTLQKDRVELGPILEDAIETGRPELDAGRFEFEVSMPDEPVLLDGDSVRLTQAFGNLLNNACKYTEAGGRIALSVELIDRGVLISIRDSGIGIAPEMLTGIFEMFAQIDRSLERSRGGLGIGLSLARRIIELHGGTLTARSHGEGHGSEFTVQLPTLASQASRLIARPA